MFFFLIFSHILLSKLRTWRGSVFLMTLNSITDGLALAVSLPHPFVLLWLYVNTRSLYLRVSLFSDWLWWLVPVLCTATFVLLRHIMYHQGWAINLWSVCFSHYWSLNWQQELRGRYCSVELCLCSDLTQLVCSGEHSHAPVLLRPHLLWYLITGLYTVLSLLSVILIFKSNTVLCGTTVWEPATS